MRSLERIISTRTWTNAKSHDIKPCGPNKNHREILHQTIVRVTISVILPPAEMSENETVCIQGVLLSDETFDALPERKINLLTIRPNYEQTS